nr:MFS transporter [Ardenticatena sp.]
MATVLAQQGRFRGWLARLGLVTREQIAWVLYDWANSAFATTVMAAVLPIYYSTVAAADLPPYLASAYWGYTTAIALALIAFISPILGAVADYMGARKRFLGIFVAVGTIFAASLALVGQGDWLLASVLFIVANVAFAGANIFYDALLPGIADEDLIDRVSAAGYAIGYLGGGLLLLLNVLWILNPSLFGIPDTTTASRLAFVSVGVWWALFSVPLFRYVPEPTRRLAEGESLRDNPIKRGWARLLDTAREIRKYRQVLIFLVAFWLYGDGIGTIIKMATIYGTEIGIRQRDLIGALVLTQFAGIPFTFAFGWLASRLGTKRAIGLGLIVYTLISIGGFFMQTAWHFWVLALAVATVQGGTQALSRSLFSMMVPRSLVSEFFGFFSVFAKFAGVLGPFMFGLIASVAGSSRLSILSLIVFFVGGLLVLVFVDVEEGRHVAAAVDAEYRPAS